MSHSLRTVSYQEGKPEPVKQPLKKSKLPVGRFDAPEDSHLEREPLKSEWSHRCLCLAQQRNASS